MANRSVVIRGVEEVKRNLRKYGRAANKALGSGLYRQGERIMGVSKGEVPVDKGILKNTGHVQLPREEAGAVVVQLGYGGPAAPYALRQHEELSYRHTVGKAKYLSDPAGAIASEIPGAVARDIERAMERA